VALERRKILVWGKTRPEISKTHREIVCTGGVFADTRRLVRLYPIPLRYMDDERVFKKYQWIEADVERNPSDARPESYKIRADGISVLDTIPTDKAGDWSTRASWVLQPQNVFRSVEELKARQAADGTSLGLVQPAEITRISAQVIGASDMAEFVERYDGALKQMNLRMEGDMERDIKPLRPAEFHWVIEFRCANDACKGHTCRVLDWEVSALYFHVLQKALKQHPKDKAKEEAKEKTLAKLREITAPDKDLYFFMGNISSHPTNFTIVGTWWPKKAQPAAERPQRSLFGNGE
jgi:hypothetical protein